jgi:abortive infection bacteriophage resistance protein
MAEYTKKWMSIDQLIDEKLLTRGMKISDRQKVKNYLLKIGYYRLSAYWHPFKRHDCPNESFVTSIEFSKIVQLYVFDKCLRLLTLDAIERIEVAFRTQIAHELGKINKFAYEPTFRTKIIKFDLLSEI